MSEQMNHRTSPSYAAPSRTPAQWAEHVAADFPSPVEYHAYHVIERSPCPGVTHTTYEPVPLPVHMRRARS